MLAPVTTQQIRIFYEADERAIFITFHGGLMHWCRPHGPVVVAEDGRRLRSTVSGWSSESVGGNALRVDRLSGHLLKTQMFRGTICAVQGSDYLVRKLNDEVLPEVLEAEQAERAHLSAIIGLMRLLTWQDFELLVDLVFSTSGWRRVGVVGRTQKTVDLELVLPTTGERAFVQVKSEATTAALRDYQERFEVGAYDRMFFVWHSGDIPTEGSTERVRLVGPERLATMVLDAGLASWLREKAS